MASMLRLKSDGALPEFRVFQDFSQKRVLTAPGLLRSVHGACVQYAGFHICPQIVEYFFCVIGNSVPQPHCMDPQPPPRRRTST